MAKKFKIVLSNKNNLTDVLNELYNETVMLIQSIQNEMNKIINSTALDGLTIEEKGEYSRVMHNFIVDKTNALKLKLDISKIITEVLKFDGDAESALNSMNKKKSEFSVDTFDLKALQKSISEKQTKETDTKQEYKLK